MMFKTLKSKLVLLLVISLSVLQLTLVMMMTHEGHESFCAFDEDCLLQYVAESSEAAQPLLTLVLPVLFFFVLYTKVQAEGFRFASSPPNFKLRKTLKGIVQRE